MQLPLSVAQFIRNGPGARLLVEDGYFKMMGVLTTGRVEVRQHV